jgi:hypothetical protein
MDRAWLRVDSLAQYGIQSVCLDIVGHSVTIVQLVISSMGIHMESVFHVQVLQRTLNTQLKHG